MASAAYKSSFYRASSPVSITTALPLTYKSVSGSDNYLEITDANKRHLSTVSNFVVKKGSAIVGAVTNTGSVSGIVKKVDYLTGRFYVDSSEPVANDYTLTAGDFLNLLEVSGIHSVTINITREVLDKTNFKDSRITGSRSKMYGIADVNISAERYDDLSKEFKDLIKNGEVVLIVFKTAQGSIIQGYFTLENSNSQGGVGDIEGESLSFQLSGNKLANFSWT